MLSALQSLMKMTDLTPSIPDLLPESASDLLSYTTLMMTQEEVSENAGEGKMGAGVKISSASRKCSSNPIFR